VASCDRLLLLPTYLPICLSTMALPSEIQIRMGKKYLLHHAIAHPEFRLPELQSVAELYGFESTLKLPEKEEDRDPKSPFLIVELEEEEHARQLAKRCVLIK
jgi:tRNA (guanine10-N2)-methyltransferase